MKIPGLPKAELIDRFYVLYRVQHEYDINMDSTYSTRISIEDMYLNLDHPIKTKIVSFKYIISKNIPQFIDYVLSGYILQVRNKILTILSAPMEDIPTHINDPEAYGELACWRLMLPKIDLNESSYGWFPVPFSRTQVPRTQT